MLQTKVWDLLQVQELPLKFDKDSWLKSLNISWSGFFLFLNRPFFSSLKIERKCQTKKSVWTMLKISAHLSHLGTSWSKSRFSFTLILLMSTECLLICTKWQAKAVIKTFFLLKTQSVKKLTEFMWKNFKI